MSTTELYYADFKTVRQRSIDAIAPDGSRSRTMGFPVCTLTDAAPLDAAEHIADALNFAEGKDELLKALAFAASVIKSGEPWTVMCEKMIGGALARARGES